MLMCPYFPALGPQIWAESQNVVGNREGGGEEASPLSLLPRISVLSRNLGPGLRTQETGIREIQIPILLWQLNFQIR